jgi:hypothetical protein
LIEALALSTHRIFSSVPGFGESWSNQDRTLIGRTTDSGLVFKASIGDKNCSISIGLSDYGLIEFAIWAYLWVNVPDRWRQILGPLFQTCHFHKNRDQLKKELSSSSGGAYSIMDSVLHRIIKELMLYSEDSFFFNNSTIVATFP